MEKKELAITIAKDLLIALVGKEKVKLISQGDTAAITACGDTLEALSKRVSGIISSMED